MLPALPRGLPRAPATFSAWRKSAAAEEVPAAVRRPPVSCKSLLIPFFLFEVPFIEAHVKCNTKRLTVNVCCVDRSLNDLFNAATLGVDLPGVTGELGGPCVEIFKWKTRIFNKLYTMCVVQENTPS